MLAGLLQHFATATVLALIAAGFCRVIRPGPAARHALWLVVLIKLAMPPVVVVRTPWAWPVLPALGDARQPNPSRPGSESTSASLSALNRPAIGQQPVQVPQPSTRPEPNQSADAIDAAALPLQMQPNGAARRPSTADVIAGVWIFGTLLYLALQAVRIARLRRWLQCATPPTGELVARMAVLARRLDLPVVPIRVVSELSSPLIWSMRRPMLLWPADLPADLSETCVDGLIVHELAHVRRRDHWVSWVELVAGAIWWWNPLFWYVRTQVREHAELACDACVVASLPHGRRAYAEVLVTVCDIASRRDVPVPAIGVSTGSRRVLERRLVMIMRGHTSARLSRVAFAAMGVLIAATVPVWAQRATTPPRPGASSAAAPLPVEIAPEGPRPAAAPRPGTTTAPVVPVEPMRQAVPAEAQRLISRFEDDQTQTRREADAKLAQQRNDVVRQLQALEDSYSKAGRLDDAAAIRARVRAIESDRRSGASIAATAPSFERPGALDFYRPGTSSRRALTIPETAAASDSLERFRGQIGDTVAMTVTGRSDGAVWGTGVYTDDSSLSTAAVHAGVIRDGETRTVTVKILPAQDSYDGSQQHGVRSAPYGEWGGSYRIEGVTSAPASVAPGERRMPAAAAPMPSTKSDSEPNLTAFRDHVWESFTIEVVGSFFGSVWGTDIYTDDSSIATAAVHAGVLKPGERGTVKITLLPGQTRYAGANRNGVTTSDYGSWEGSFRLERVK